ncbi:MAG: hypothetical protein M3R69_06760 [Acidobacteriota bacterium]|nr:hypothetical protein [Acidobacteriota bacterium]
MKAKITTLAILVFFAALFLESNAEAKGWRGIVPLHSTRLDVERLLGSPTEQLAGNSVLYRTANETLMIDYAQGLTCGIGEKYSQWRVPRNTVESIRITPNMKLPLSQLSIDESKYKKFSGGHRPQDVYYINEQDGESLVVFMDEVMGITYSPAATDEYLRCPGLPGRPHTNCEGLSPIAFDSYGILPLVEEKLRLDDFVTTLKEDNNRKGYIIAYAGKRARLGEAKQRAEHEKSYLVNVSRFPSGRLYAVDGGYREKPEVEVYVVDGSGCPPTSDPTVDPRDVRIISTNRPRKNRR